MAATQQKGKNSCTRPFVTWLAPLCPAGFKRDAFEVRLVTKCLARGPFFVLIGLFTRLDDPDSHVSGSLCSRGRGKLCSCTCVSKPKTFAAANEIHSHKMRVTSKRACAGKRVVSLLRSELRHRVSSVIPIVFSIPNSISAILNICWKFTSEFKDLRTKFIWVCLHYSTVKDSTCFTSCRNRCRSSERYTTHLPTFVPAYMY